MKPNPIKCGGACFGDLYSSNQIVAFQILVQTLIKHRNDNLMSLFKKIYILRIRTPIKLTSMI